MATPKEKLAEALKQLRELQKTGIVAIHTSDLPNRLTRFLLEKHRFINEVSKGWYISTDPTEQPGTTTSWFSFYWAFVARFINSKYQDDWCLSAEQSILIHAGNFGIPQQLLVRNPGASNHATPLPHKTSLFNLRAELPASQHIEVKYGLNVYTPQAALIYSSPMVYKANPIEVRAVLAMVRDGSELLTTLLDNGHTTIAGRLAGAFRNNGQAAIADQIIDTFKQADYEIREQDPFNERIATGAITRERTAEAQRIRLMWMTLRTQILELKLPRPRKKVGAEEYLKQVNELYLTDAYHSLSIERYRVSEELIERVSSGNWNPDDQAEDSATRNALAARGYYQAFQEVRTSITAVLSGQNAGRQVEQDLNRWYRQLFDPAVAMGILKPSELAGYRTQQVFISNSKHIPLHVEAMRDAMPVLFDLMAEEPNALIRAILGHFMFVYIHPFMDGNGRIGRFIMNVMLASGHYPWTIIKVDHRDQYMAALEEASTGLNIRPFAAFVLGSLKGKVR